NTLVGADTPNTWTITGADSGTVTALHSRGFQSLTGGAVADSFVFQPGGSVSTSLDGGGGSNALDYSRYVGDITVDLALNLASLVNGGAAGSVLHIANVTGSIGNDLLVGDANANVLVGGTGRNLIIGGGGGDTLDARPSGGDNLLIGGTTDYDQNLTALNALMAEFVRTDEGFDQRVNNIRRGQGLLAGSGIHLDRDTVHADLAPDALWGGAGQNWFFVD